MAVAIPLNTMSTAVEIIGESNTKKCSVFSGSQLVWDGISVQLGPNSVGWDQ